MRRQQWPGFATAVAMILVLTIIVAVARDPEFKLKDWQTFMAACVALVGGFFAYNAAMAKVDFDREVAAFDFSRERLALFIKLSIALELLGKEVKRQRTWADVPMRDYSRLLDGISLLPAAPTRSIAASDFKFDYPEELTEAWGKLDLFPDPIVTILANIRSTLRTVEGSIIIWGGEKSWKYSRIDIPDDIRNMIRILEDLESFCADAVKGIEGEIRESRAQHLIGRAS